MRKNLVPAALALAMLLAGNPWQTGNWGGGIAAALLTGLVAHGRARFRPWSSGPSRVRLWPLWGPCR
ncbi:hypothetical protein GCM10010519_30560 [Streptomyces lactacystinicus]